MFEIGWYWFFILEAIDPTLVSEAEYKLNIVIDTISASFGRLESEIGALMNNLVTNMSRISWNICSFLDLE